MTRDKVYLQNILDAICDIESFIKNVDEKEFCENKEKQYAVLRALEIIGEAVKSLSRNLRIKYTDVPWRDMAGMRDKLIHMYFGVKLDLVWETIINKLPEVKEQICGIIKHAD